MGKFHWAFVLIIVVAICSPAHASNKDFDRWLNNLRYEAEAAGVSRQVVQDNLGNDLHLIERVIELDRKQPEKKITFEDYKNKIVNLQRVRYGQMHMRKDRNLLYEISNHYGVEPEYIVALWGIETNYGANIGGFDIIPALVTMAYEGRRSEFFKSELFGALRIIDDGMPRHKLRGSWAGAMGQCQFMPSSYHAYAVDYDGDGRKDIWNTKADIFASIANYLSKSGWKKNQSLLEQVKFTRKLTPEEWTFDVVKPISHWKKLGVVYANGESLPDSDENVAIVQPGGDGYKIYMSYGNYRVIMKWNKSTYFATSVKYLADLLKKY